MTKPNPYLEKLRCWLKTNPYGSLLDVPKEEWDAWVDKTLDEFRNQPKWPTRKYKPREGRNERRSTRNVSRFGHHISKSPDKERRIDFGTNRKSGPVGMPKFSFSDKPIKED